MTPLSSQLQPTVEPLASEKLLTWDDQAGFTFQYPKSLLVDTHPEDDQNYSNLSFTNKDNPGGILVMASDTKAKDVAAWVKADKSLVGGLVIETTLGGKPAKKISFADSGKVVVGAIDDQILFRLETNNLEPYWQNTFNRIVDSFEFVYPTSAPAASSGGISNSSSGIIEEEEIIQ